MPLTCTILGIPSGPIVRNSGLWKPDGRKGEWKQIRNGIKTKNNVFPGENRGFGKITTMNPIQCVIRWMQRNDLWKHSLSYR